MQHCRKGDCGRVHVQRFSTPTESSELTVEALLHSADNHTIVGWYILNIGIGVRPSPAIMAKMCDQLTDRYARLPAHRPSALYHVVVVDCVKSHQSADAHLECYNASDALSCDADGRWDMNLDLLKCIDWSLED